MKIAAGIPQLATLAVLTLPAPTARAAALWEVTVEAGEHARDHTVTSFPLGPDYVGKSFVLRDPRGAMLPVQVDATGRAVFVLPSLKAGATVTYFLEERNPASTPPGVSVSEDRETIRVAVNRRPLLHYRKNPKSPQAGALHPVLSPGGVVVTGEDAGGRGRHGIWSSLAKLEDGPRKLDFASAADTAARAQIESVGPTWSGPISGGFQARHIYIDAGDKTGPTWVREEWEVRAYAPHGGRTPYQIFDVDIKDWASRKDLIVQKSLHAGLGVRGRAEWTGKKLSLVASTGKEGLATDLAVVKWFRLGGQAGGRTAGIAALYHPGNPGPPLMTLEPETTSVWFGVARLKPFVLVRNTAYNLRARFVVTDGAIDRKLLARLSADYDHPPRVTMNPVGGPDPALAPGAKRDAGAPAPDGGVRAPDAGRAPPR